MSLKQKTAKVDRMLRDSGFEFHRENHGVIIYENKFTGTILERRGNKLSRPKKLRQTS